jgi:DNA-directed RNA polymerase specialized sigma24 family protein
MAKKSYLDTEGGDHWFHTTQWTEICRLPKSDGSVRSKLLETLLSRYWSPIYWYIRKKGYDRDQAKDLTQDFFHEIVLGRKLFDKASQDKGRLRNFLLVAVERYLVSFERKRSAKKRRPAQAVISLEQVDCPEPQTEEDPEQAFSRAWAAELLDRSLAEFRGMCVSLGDQVLWSIFNDVLLEPIFNNADRPSFKEVCQRYHIESESKASNMLITAKRRFRGIMRGILQESVGSQGDVDCEIMELLENFGQ